MVILPKTADLHDKVVATIQTARLLPDLWDSVDLDVGPDLRAIRNLMAELAAGEVFAAEQEAPLVSLATHILAHFGRHLPGYVEIARRGSTDDYPLDDPDLDAMRVFWSRLHDCRRLRQLVLDEIRAEQIIGRLRRAMR